MVVSLVKGDVIGYLIVPFGGRWRDEVLVFANPYITYDGGEPQTAFTTVAHYGERGYCGAVMAADARSAVRQVCVRAWRRGVKSVRVLRSAPRG